MSTSEKAERLRVMWNKSRNYFQSFLSELGEVRKTMGSDKLFARWCMEELHISIGVITNTAEILKKADAAIARTELQGAKNADRAERQRMRAEAEAERQRIRELKLANVVAKKARKQHEDKKKRDREYYKRAKEQKLQSYAALAPKVVDQKIIQFPDTQLASEIKAAVQELSETRSAWIDASIRLAGLLHEARRRFNSDNAFGEWLVRHDININKNDRAALIDMGSNIEAMRQILETTGKTSYQYIWQDVQRQLPSG